jgi:hypothetical protein
MNPPWRVLVTVSAAVFVASLDLFIVNIARSRRRGSSMDTPSWMHPAWSRRGTPTGAADLASTDSACRSSSPGSA